MEINTNSKMFTSKLDGILETLKDELIFVEKQIDDIKEQIETAKQYDTSPARTTRVMLGIWLERIEKRVVYLKDAIKKTEELKQ
jgi:hypothetical protein